MMEALQILGLAVAVLYGIGVVITLFELWRAPHGYEDEQGFHESEPGREFPTARGHEHTPPGTLPA